MPYLGNNLGVAFSSYKLIDSLTASFNGTTTSFALTVNGVTPVPFPLNEQNILISVGGVPQKPDSTGTEGFRFSGSNIVFSSAPKTGEAFWGVVLAGADRVNAGVQYPDGTASVPSITFASQTTTGFYRSGSGQIGVGINGSTPVAFSTSGVQLNGSTSGSVIIASPAVAGNNTLTLPTSNGSANQFLKNGATAGSLGYSSMVEDSSGRVGIGTNSPAQKLEIQDGSISVGSSANVNATNVLIAGYGYILSGTKYGNTSIRSTYENVSNTAPLEFYVGTGGTGTAEKMRLTADGKLLVGTSTSVNNLLDGALQIVGTSADSYITATRYSSTAADPAGIILGRSKSATKGTNTIVASGDTLGAISFSGANGTSFDQAANIVAFVDGTPGASGDMPGRLVFSTTADGASSPTERMRIHANGYITYGTGILDSTGLTFGPTRSGAGSAPTLTWNGSFTGTTTACDFLYNGVRQGSITTTTSATAYNTSSDYRLKENIEPLTGASGRLNQLQVHRFNFISDPGRTVDGFIAHEAQAVVPECVTGEKDAEDEDGNPKYQGIDQSKLVPLLTAALQEAIAEIASLKDRVAALEGA